MSREELPVIQDSEYSIGGHPKDDRFGVKDRQALRLPDFLKKNIGKGDQVNAVHRLMRGSSLHTVCEEARCPNLNECFKNKTATFMIMGKDCTRACGFCAVGTAKPAPLDENEPEAVAHAALELGLSHVVITSVNRDDLSDGGAKHMSDTVWAVKNKLPQASIEVLTPDFLGDMAAVSVVASSPLDVYNHNIETVERLYPRVRPKARYERSLAVLQHVAQHFPQMKVKSGMMVGLGETQEEIFQLMRDLRDHGVHIFTIGQYMRPSLINVPVVEYLKEESYQIYRDYGKELGFDFVFAGPFVRSSYHAGEALVESQKNLLPINKI
jgi:lipoic acid synthetase